MTLVSEIIHDAFRVSNITAVGVDPTTAQQTEALRHLDRIVKGTLSAEIGENLIAFPIGRANISKPAGYPWYNTVPDGDWFVPKNTRAMCNLEEPVSLYLHPIPNDGTRFAIKDVAENFSTYNVTIYGNGNQIEGATSVTLSTDDMEQEWFYRADEGNWVTYAPLATTDTFPFPTEFDDFFIYTLAMRLNPSYGAAIEAQGGEMLNRVTRHMKARYNQSQPTRSELGLIRHAYVAADRDGWARLDDYWGSDTTLFNRGYPW